LKKYLAALLLMLSLAACGSPGVDSTAVSLGEFWVGPGADRLQAGTVVLTVENYGEFPHTLVISDSSGTVLAATDLVNPEEEVDLTVTLEPGTYSFTCRIVVSLEDGTVIDHYQEGMATSVEVVAPA
jgi:plastocyanin